MPKLPKRRADIRLIGRVLGGRVHSARRSVKFRHFDQGRLRQTIEVEPGIQLIRSADPLRPKRNLVFAAVGDRLARHQRRLDVVVHVPGGAGGDEPHDMVGRVVRVDDHSAVAMVADRPPMRRIRLERAVLEHLSSGTAGILDHADVVQEDFAGLQQPEYEFVPPSIGPDGTGAGCAPIGDGLPLGVGCFVAGGPRFGHGIVGVGIAQLETGSAAVGKSRPTPPFVVVDFIGRIPQGILQHDTVADVRELPREIADDPDRVVLCPKRRGVLGHDEILPGGQRCLGGEFVLDRVLKRPTAQINRQLATIEQFDPFLGRVLARLTANRLDGRMMVHDFVDHDRIIQREVIGRGRRGHVGNEPTPRSVR